MRKEMGFGGEADESTLLVPLGRPGSFWATGHNCLSAPYPKLLCLPVSALPVVAGRSLTRYGTTGSPRSRTVPPMSPSFIL